MIQFNLLPDVKLQYLKAERTRRVVMAVSVLVIVISLAMLLLLLSVTVLQRKHLSDLNRDITSDNRKLENQPDLTKILTIQNQLTSLTGLHDTKPAANRLAAYLSQIVPAQVNLNNLTIDFAAHTITISGTADAISTANKFVDTLKFTSYKVDAKDPALPAFSNVVLSSFGLSNKQITYSVNFVYDPVIFDITQNVSLSVPNLVTTRSEVEKPSDLFTSTNNQKVSQ